MAMAAAVGAGLASMRRKAAEMWGPGWVAPLTAGYVAFQAWALDKYADAESPATAGMLAAGGVTLPLGVAAGVLSDMIPAGHGFIEKTIQLGVAGAGVVGGTYVAAELAHGDGSILNGFQVDMGSIPVEDMAAYVVPQIPAAVGGILIGDSAHKKAA